MGYTPVFDHIYQGTLYGKWPAAAVWASLLPLCDKNGVIAYSWNALTGMTGWPLELLRQGINELMQPDPGSNSQAESGKRLVPYEQRDGKDWGWQAVNHGRYRERARKQAWDAERTASGRDAERKRAQRETSRDVPTRPDSPRSQTQTHTQTQTEEKKAATAALASLDEDVRNFEAFKAAYPRRSGSQPWIRARRAISARLDEGETWPVILAGVARYAAWCESTGKIDTEVVMQAATFCGPDKHYLELWKLPTARAGPALTWRPDPADDPPLETAHA